MAITNQPQKTKICSKTKEKRKKFVQISQIVDGTGLNTSFDYYDYYDLEDFNKIPINNWDLALLHMNISSLPVHIDDVKTFRNLLSINFDITCIFKSRLSERPLL